MSRSPPAAPRAPGAPSQDRGLAHPGSRLARSAAWERLMKTGGSRDGAGAGNPLRTPGASPLGRDPGPGTSALRAPAVSRGCSRCFDRVHLAGHRWRRARGHRTRRAPGKGRPRAWPLFPARGAAEAPGSSVASRVRSPGTFTCARCPAVTGTLEAGGAAPYPCAARPPACSAAAAMGVSGGEAATFWSWRARDGNRPSPRRVSAQIIVRARV